jgi:hypothetical protein
MSELPVLPGARKDDKWRVAHFPFSTNILKGYTNDVVYSCDLY